MIRNIIRWIGEKLGFVKPQKKVRYIRGWRKTREEVWRKYFGDSKTGKCYCCGKLININKKVDGEGWECSHVKAFSKGGSNKINNLRACCRKCNRSMGTKNLYDYRKEVYGK